MMRRLFRRLLVTAIVLVVLLAVALLVIHLVLRSDLPRQWVIESLRTQTGLRVEARSLTTTWSGRTVLHDVTAALPLEDEPFLTAPEMRVAHTGVIRLLLFRTLELESVEIPSPTLLVEQDEAGAWNVADAARTIALAQEKPGDGGGGGVKIPRISVESATVRVSPKGREAHAFEGVNFAGEPVGELVWRFFAELPGATVEGRVVPWPSWRHEVDIDAPELAALLWPWSDALPDPLSFEGRWVGQVEDGQLTGRLRIDPLLVDQMVATGTLVLPPVRDSDELGVRAEALRLAFGEALPEALLIEAGTFRRRGGSLVAEAVDVKFLGIAARMNASWDVEARAGVSRFEWNGQALGPIARHDGVLEITAAMPATARITATANLDTRGDAWGGEWNGNLRLRLEGTSPQSFDADLTAPRLSWRDQGGPVVADGLAMSIAVRNPVVRLTHLRVPGAATSAATAEMNLQSRAWRVDLDVGRWTSDRLPSDPVGIIGPGRPVSLIARGSGDAQRANVETLVFTSGPLALQASGDYDLTRDPQVRSKADVTFRLPEPQGRSLAPRGNVRSQFEVFGNVQPLNLAAKGTSTPDVLLGDNPVRDVAIPWSSTLTPETVVAEVSRFEFLGGAWQGKAELTMTERIAHVRGAAEGVSLERVTALLGWPVRVQGSLTAQLASDIPDFNLGEIEVAGTWGVTDLETTAFRGEKGGGNFRWNRGAVNLDEIRIDHAGGFAEGSLSFNILERQKLNLHVRTTKWPVETPRGAIRMLVDGKAALEMDLAGRGASGQLSLAAETIVKGTPAGRVSLDGKMAGRTIEITTVQGDIYQGELSGQMVIPLDDWINSRGELSFRDLDLSVLADSGLPTASLAGRASGRMSFERSRDPRALEPLAIRLDVESEGRYRDVPFGDVHLVAYAGPQRFIVDASSIDVAHGRARLWMSVSERDKRPFIHAVLGMEQLDLDLLVHSLAPNANHMPGLLSGQVRAFGFASSPYRAAGDADLQLTNSDLARSDIIGAVYNAMSLDVGDPEPTGRGRAELRLEGETIELSRLRYFNRGTEVIAHGRLHELAKGVDSPITVHAAGTARPFREVKLLNRVDDLLRALQASMTAVEARGTLREPEPRVIPLPNVSAALGRLLQGRVEEEQANR